MPDEQFSIAYDGEAVRLGLMDVRELAPALLATGELIQQANKLLNGDNRSQIVVQVRSDFRTGSFEIHLNLVQGLLDQAKTFLALHPQIKETKEILETIFYFTGKVSAGPVGLFRLVKWLGRRKIEKTEQIPPPTTEVVRIAVERITGRPPAGVVRVYLTDTLFLDVLPEALTLFNDPAIRRSIEGMTAPLRRVGIDDLKIRYAGKEEIVTAEEADSFVSEQEEGETLIDVTNDAALSIVRLSFNPSHKWGFTNGSGRITAKINDQRFWSDVLAAKVKFAQGDQIIVSLRTRTYRTDAGDLKSDFFVEHVIKHIPRGPSGQNSLLPTFKSTQN